MRDWVARVLKRSNRIFGITPMTDTVSHDCLPASMNLGNWSKVSIIARFAGRYDPTLFVRITWCYPTFHLFKNQICPTFERVAPGGRKGHSAQLIKNSKNNFSFRVGAAGSQLKMLRTKTTIIALFIAATLSAALPSDANADGPLRRWWRGLHTPKTCCPTPTPTASSCCPPTTANYTPNPYDLKPGQCMKTCQQTCTRTVVNYVPCTAYRTVTKRVPVTQYRPETTSDPCTGCVVTCMKPCTTYTYQCQRVPYTTYRPVYRQETYKVPVTTITNDCSTGACNTCPTGTCATGTCGTGCDSCGTGGMSQQPNYAPTPAPAPQTSTYYETPPSSISTGDSYGQGGFTPAAPANQTPSLGNPTSFQKPVTERLNSGFVTGYQQSHEPATINIRETASRSPAHERWSYSPVRLASYKNPTATRTSLPPVARQMAPLTPVQPQSRQPVRQNGWVEVN